MAYKLRTRKPKRNYFNSSSSSDDSDSNNSDPDFSRSRPRRRLQQNVASINPMHTAENEVGEEGVASSSRIETTERRRGRPPKNRDNRERGEQSTSTRGRGRRNHGPNTQRRPSNSNSNNDRASLVKRTILSWLIDLEMVQENAKVCYLDQTREQVLLEGAITRDGILCRCCDIVVTVWDFEVHAGSNLKRPYENIYVETTHMSLLSCQIEAWSLEEGAQHCGFNHIEPQCSSTDKNDDACMLCADGGELICCERCPSTFHANCMGMKRVPNDDWLCPNCVCKYCGVGDGGDNPLYTCCQCDKKYHWKCFQERGELLDLNGPGTCGQSCGEIYKKLEEIEGVRNELDEGFSWTLLRRKDTGAWPTSYSDDLHHRTLCNSNIVVAWHVMDECFTTIIDRHTQTNMVHSVVYNRGSNFPRINFSSFYTAILEKGEEIISVASLRIHGSKLAEMPFVGTRQSYRHKGMCRKLLVAIESALCFLNVKNLVIPSVSELVRVWIDKYGFSHIEEELRKDLLDFNILMFPKTIKLQKTLLTQVMEDNESKNNEHRDKLAPHFDLNLEPPDEDEQVVIVL